MLSTPSSSKAGGAGERLLALLQKGVGINRLLTFSGLAMLVALLVSLIGLVLDHRIITGIPAWIKPTKFAVSISVYNFTLLWFLHFIQGHRRLVSFVANGIAMGMSMEWIFITLQLIRGTISHYNFSTPFDATVTISMAGFIILVFLLNVVAVILLIRQRMTDPVLAWSLRLGLLLSLFGMFIAFLMTTGELQRGVYSALYFLQPDAFPMTKLHFYGSNGIIGAHSVGVEDGGPGLPFLGWSTIAGDLRPAHFIGLHALQALPLFGWLLGHRIFAALSVWQRVALVWVFALAYLWLVCLLIWVALRSQSIIAPDSITLQAYALLLGSIALTVGFIVIQAWRGRKRYENSRDITR